MPILLSDNLDPFHNLAVESCLLDGVGPGLPVLFLWQSDKAVVIGKNQNPWRECNLPYMEANQIPLCRRESGGGAVYHDQGNLNFCMVLDRNTYREQVQFDLIIEALNTLGLEGRREGQSSLYVGEYKVSGNAYCFRRNRVMHHGTLLVHTDLDVLRESLQASPLPMDTHAIASVPASVMNLAEVKKGLSVDALKAVLMQTWGKKFPPIGKHQALSCISGTEIDKHRERLASHSWYLGHTPAFTLQAAGQQIQLSVRKGRIASIGDDKSVLTPDALAWLEKSFLHHAMGTPGTADHPPSEICARVLQDINNLSYHNP